MSSDTSVYFRLGFMEQECYNVALNLAFFSFSYYFFFSGSKTTFALVFSELKLLNCLSYCFSLEYTTLFLLQQGSIKEEDKLADRFAYFCVVSLV